MKRLEIFGCGKPPIYHPRYPHDNISLYRITKEAIFKRSSELYEKGYSLQAISQEIKIPKSTVRDALISGGVVLRSHSRKPKKQFNWTKYSPSDFPKIALRNAPYGYYLSKGALKLDSREQEIIQLILEMWRKEMSHGAIARELNKQKIKPRKAKKWSQVVIGFIIKRHQLQNKNKEK